MTVLPELLSALATALVAGFSSVAVSRTWREIRDRQEAMKLRDGRTGKAGERLAVEIQSFLSADASGEDRLANLESLLEALNDIDSAVLLLDNVVIVKQEGQVNVHALSANQAGRLSELRELLQQPDRVLAWLRSTEKPPGGSFAFGA